MKLVRFEQETERLLSIYYYLVTCLESQFDRSKHTDPVLKQLDYQAALLVPLPS